MSLSKLQIQSGDSFQDRIIIEVNNTPLTLSLSPPLNGFSVSTVRRLDLNLGLDGREFIFDK